MTDRNNRTVESAEVASLAASTSVRLLPPFARWQMSTATLRGMLGRTEVEIATTDMMRPRMAVAINGRKGAFVNTSRMSAVLLDESEEIVETTITVIDADGIRTPRELVLLELVTQHEGRALLSDTTEQVREQLGGPNGLNGPRAERSIREFYRDRSWLRLVWKNDEPEPDPAGPVAYGEAA